MGRLNRNHKQLIVAVAVREIGLKLENIHSSNNLYCTNTGIIKANFIQHATHHPAVQGDSIFNTVVRLIYSTLQLDIAIVVLCKWHKITFVFQSAIKEQPWAQQLRQRTCTQQTWVQLPMLPIRVIGGGTKGIQPKLLPCNRKSPTYLGRLVGTSTSLNKGVVTLN